MNKILNILRKKIIVSCQATKGDAFYEEDCPGAVIKAVIKGGAGGLRLAGVKDIRGAKLFTDIPVIGITKPEPLPENPENTVYITSTFNEAKQVSGAGADIIAIDGTPRQRPEENLEQLIHKIKHTLNKPVMADISTLDEGISCSEMGADIIATTLSGYTGYTLDKNNGEPDFELLKELINTINLPVILEGRIWTPEHVKRAFDLGAYAVVIGSAITRPEFITRRFVKLGKAG